ncbi:hypothetical protein F6W69_06060 [Microbacterium oxydans]|uniref:hypothetical protein n=1 Tax=Microbacterium oxydans TaxID=82380 RepID=UPI001142C9F7|nr:hypothetical protein [Microbacterium oxydans]KAB1893588.1 hypothetical protein F6W69_06060 [Microbacterium oxydans]GED38087.1 hypothetical protein MOX01_12290 [Microbacterium oxydans]
MSTQQMTARTMSMTLDPMRANPVTSAVASIRDLQTSLAPSGGAVRETGRRQVDALVATGLYSVTPRR